MSVPQHLVKTVGPVPIKLIALNALVWLDIQENDVKLILMNAPQVLAEITPLVLTRFVAFLSSMIVIDHVT